MRVTVTRIRSAPVVDYTWQADAACRGSSGELFLGPDGESPRDQRRRESLAVRLCEHCPARQACLTHALTVPEDHGIWGGTTPDQRRRLRIDLDLAMTGDGDLDADLDDGCVVVDSRSHRSGDRLDDDDQLDAVWLAVGGPRAAGTV